VGAILREFRLNVEFSDTFDMLENSTVKKELPVYGAHERRNMSDYWLNSVTWCTRNDALYVMRRRQTIRNTIYDRSEEVRTKNIL
jgi:hypothetical protein